MTTHCFGGHLIGKQEFEPKESNPMLGFRGASHYCNDRYRDGFALECSAARKVRECIGLDNIIVMIPFCRTVEELRRVLAVMAENRLERGENGLQVYVMAEIPANIILAGQFAEYIRLVEYVGGTSGAWRVRHYHKEQYPRTSP